MGYDLDRWQVELVRSVMEIVPDGFPRAGRLRWRQFLISVARQNGKSELAALLGLLMLLMRPRGLVIGIASSADQARIVYTRAMAVVRGTPGLTKRFVRITDTRGLGTRTGGRYEIKAAKEAALQSIPVDLGIVDEVHLLARVLWDALVNGTGGRDDCLVVGITTSGDESSVLLKDLYALAEAGDLGHAIWEAPEARVPSDDDELGYFLRCANPAIAAGRVPVGNVIEDVRKQPEESAVRYRLNRFVAGSSAAFVSPVVWSACAWLPGEDFPTVRDGSTPGGGRVVFVVDRTPEWSHAAVTASVKDAAGVVWTQVVASLEKPDLRRLEAVCVQLGSVTPGALFAFDGYALKDLEDPLRRAGLDVKVLRQADVLQACSLAFARIVRGTVRHAGDPLVVEQLPGTKRKAVGTAFRIVRADTSADIDAVMATVLGVYLADTLPEYTPQVF